MKPVKSQRGFSLIELLIIIVVVGILASMAMRSMDVAVDDTRKIKTTREMEALAQAITGDASKVQNNARSDFGFIGDIGAFPPSLQALRQNTVGWGTWRGPYLNSTMLRDTIGYRLDEWGQPYSYSGGTTITSSGSGSSLVHRLADNTSDYLRNRIQGTVLDIAGAPPGPVLADSVAITVTVPNGTGGTVSKTCYPDSLGSFALDSIPVGRHPLTCVLIPEIDTLFRFINVMPRHRGRISLRFAYPYFFGDVTLPGNDTLIAADFNTGDDAFVYFDDAFRGTGEPDYANGAWEAFGGFSGGKLLVELGGVDNSTVNNMSGGWERVFNMPEAGNVRLTFRYELGQTAEYENDEYTQALISLDGVLYGDTPNDYVDILVGDGPGGAWLNTGWESFEVVIGPLTAGPHTLLIGGFNNKKTTINEESTIKIDDVLAIWEPEV